MNKPLILLVEDTASLAMVYKEYLSGEDIDVLHVSTGAEAMQIIERRLPSVLLLDIKLPDMDGMEILNTVNARQLPVAVVMMTAYGTVDMAVEAMNRGAFDFLEKPFDAKRLKTTVINVLKRLELQHLVDDIESSERDHFHGFIGQSAAMQAVYRIIESAAPSKATVFITGESGTGKEVCAEAIHKQSDRCEKPFIAINCGAIPKDLMESEIFGHVKGAFTGAVNSREGAASQADGGTLFLDEIGEMDMDLQTKLLRFVQTGRFQKVGGSKEQAVDVRFVCATNRDPLEEVAAGRFREDLYYRLHVVPIQLPALRDRSDDIMLIANRFLREYSQEENKHFQCFDDQVEVIFRHYQWPGNVRQLQNVIRNMIVLNSGTEITSENLPPPLNTLMVEPAATMATRPRGVAEPVTATGSGKSVQDTGGAIRPLWVVEKEAIERAVEICNGNIPKAAAMLEVSPSTIYRKKQGWE